MLLKEPKRSVDYILDDSDPDLCDRVIIEGWYRILDDGNIPTTCPPILRCGSTAPIWLNGQLPTRPNEQRTITACMRGFEGCCDDTLQIDVRHCTVNNRTFNVFYLLSLSSCPGRYCIEGPPAPCPPGEVSESGFEPCERLRISFSVTPYVEAFIPTTGPDQKLAFKCKISMPDIYRSYRFDIAWFVGNDEEFIRKEKMSYTELETVGVLYRMEWDPGLNKTLGFWVKCAIRARENIVSPPTPYNTSAKFYAGATFHQTSFRVKAGEPVTVYIRSTVPIPCIIKKRCKIRIELFSFQDQFKSSPAQCNDTLTDTKSIKAVDCGARIDGAIWDQQQQFTLNTARDQSSRKSYTCTAKYRAVSNLDFTLWQNYVLPDIRIDVLNDNRPQSTCSSINDPHIRTFDGKPYTALEKGEFVLYKNRDKPLAVHTIHRWESGSQWSSNCAIIVKAASDMFAIYGCDSSNRWITKRLNCDADHQYLEVFHRGMDYDIILPTGTRIVVKINSSWLNIHIHISSGEWGQTSGLCGTYNGNIDDDFSDSKWNILNQADFISSWWVSKPESLFIASSRKEKMKTQVMYCSCMNKTIVEDTDFSTEGQCTWHENLESCKPMNWKEDKCQSRGKRDAVDDFELDAPVDLVEFEKSDKEFKWRNGWTEEKAMNTCISYSNQSKLFSVCTKKLNIPSDLGLETCVRDIKISGSEMFLTSSLDLIKSKCINELIVNPKYWKPKPVTTQTNNAESEHIIETTSSKHVLTETTTAEDLGRESDFDINAASSIDISDLVYNLNCPNDCSNAGKCHQGICTCKDGFAGDDCSAKTTSPPDLDGATELSFCDISKRECLYISLFGNGLYESDSVKCRIREAKLKGKNVEPGLDNITTEGQMVSFAELKCPLAQMTSVKNNTFPTLDAYLISVSLNEVAFSNESPVIIYDSTCTVCNVLEGEIKCIPRDDICIKDRTCYHKDDAVCKMKEKQHTKKMTELWMIGAALGGFSIVVIPIVFVIKR